MGSTHQLIEHTESGREIVAALRTKHGHAADEGSRRAMRIDAP
jgi:hypothetical protein